MITSNRSPSGVIESSTTISGDFFFFRENSSAQNTHSSRPPCDTVRSTPEAASRYVYSYVEVIGIIYDYRFALSHSCDSTFFV